MPHCLALPGSEPGTSTTTPSRTSGASARSADRRPGTAALARSRADSARMPRLQPRKGIDAMSRTVVARVVRGKSAMELERMCKDGRADTHRGQRIANRADDIDAPTKQLNPAHNKAHSLGPESCLSRTLRASDRRRSECQRQEHRLCCAMGGRDTRIATGSVARSRQASLCIRAQRN